MDFPLKHVFWFVAVSCLTVAGCFKDPVDGGSGSGSDTGTSTTSATSGTTMSGSTGAESGTDSTTQVTNETGTCPDGSVGCPCYGNGTCDLGLECQNDDVCLPPNCTPGSLGCECVRGECLGALVCDGTVCIEPPSSEVGPGPTSVEETGVGDTTAVTGFETGSGMDSTAEFGETFSEPPDPDQDMYSDCTQDEAICPTVIDGGVCIFVTEAQKFCSNSDCVNPMVDCYVPPGSTNAMPSCMETYDMVGDIVSSCVLLCDSMTADFCPPDLACVMTMSMGMAISICA